MSLWILIPICATLAVGAIVLPAMDQDTLQAILTSVAYL